MKISALNPREHGGDPLALEARFGVPKDGWLDLSTGINPTAYGVDACPLELLQRLPLQQDLDALLVAARKAYGVPDEAAIVAGPGTQALIQLVPTLFKPSQVSIVSPTYGEHAPAWAAAEHEVIEVNNIVVDTPYALVVHPNNPDGRVQEVENVLSTAADLFKRGGTLVVDEAFAEVRSDVSVTPHAGRDGLIVLRSFGKFFGLAGVRLGFAICTPKIADQIKEKLGPWSVSGPAIWAGTQALNDADWMTETRQRLADDAVRLGNILENAGFRKLGGTDLFCLIECQNAQAVYETLGQLGILVRAFKAHPTWLRFGLPGDEAGWKRLESAL